MGQTLPNRIMWEFLSSHISYSVGFWVWQNMPMHRTSTSGCNFFKQPENTELWHWRVRVYYFFLKQQTLTELLPCKVWLLFFNGTTVSELYGPGRLGCMFSFDQPTIIEIWLFKVEGISFIKKITNSFSSVNACVYIYLLHAKITSTLQMSQPIIPWARAFRALIRPMVYHMAMAQRPTFFKLKRRIKEPRYIEKHHY